MQFSICRDDLLDELHVLRRYLSKQIPALGDFLFEADDKLQRLTVTASDASNIIQVSLNANVKKGGALILSSTILYGGLKGMPQGEEVTFKKDATSSHLLMTCKKSKLKIPTMPASAYISIPSVFHDAELEISSDDFARIIQNIAFARMERPTSSADFKFEGIHMKVTQGVARFTCSDRSRIAVEYYRFNNPIDAEFLFNGKALADFVNNLESGKTIKIKASLMSNQIILECDNKLLYVSQYQDKYPDVSHIIPNPTTTIVVNRNQLQNCLEIASLIHQRIELSAKGRTLSLSSRSSGAGEYSDAISATLNQPITVALNVKYFLDGLKAMDGDEVELLFVDEKTPAIVRPKGNQDYAYLLLPVA